MGELVFVKYCPLCGAENPRQQAFCLACLDGDLTTVPVEPKRDAVPPAEAAAPAAPSLTLELVDNPSIRFTVCENQTVGRTDKADVVLCGVPKLEWISGAHARFSRRGSQWYVKHIGSTNYIKVDGETYSGQEEVALYPDAILVLSLTAFRVVLPEEATPC